MGAWAEGLYDNDSALDFSAIINLVRKHSGAR